MGVVHGDIAEKQLDILIERRSRNGEVDPDELEPSYAESVRRYNAGLQEERRAAWCEHHQDQAARLRAVLEALIARHEGEAAKLMEARPKGTA